MCIIEIVNTWKILKKSVTVWIKLLKFLLLLNEIFFHLEFKIISNLKMDQFINFDFSKPFYPSDDYYDYATEIFNQIMDSDFFYKV
jgi:hypothetical protein